ncbi:MAG TPA: ScpA family protein [Burkholderiales bacterium]|jgi:segregation and condensation protein A|nr:ScpA family protein [Burkholderiales bacterium]
MVEAAAFPLHAPVTPVGKFRGEPVLELPHDLYIPPDALEVFLETFEGPLDLLLYLIRKHNLDVLDIPMARLTEQYLEYVELMRQKSLELAGEYLVMAAVLIEIKSRMLLPRPPAASQDENDPRAELIRRLLAYEQMKLAAQRIDELPQVGRDFALVQVWIEQPVAQALPDVSPEDLRQAWLWLLQRASVNQHHRVTRDQLSVREHMTLILRRLHDVKFLEFTQLFSPSDGVPRLVVTFLAILELAREALIEVTQHEAYSPIYVKLTHGLTVV